MSLKRSRDGDDETFEKGVDILAAGGGGDAPAPVTVKEAHREPAAPAATFASLPPAPFVFPPRYAVTITFGDAAENHVGMQKLGAKADSGFSCAEVRAIRDRLASEGYVAELIDLTPAYYGAAGGGAGAAAGGGGGLVPDEACVLVLRNPLGTAEARELFREQYGLNTDKKAFMKGRVVNKLARHNLCFAEAAQEPDYEAGKGRVVSWASIPHLSALRDRLESLFGSKAAGLYGEGNYYFDTTSCGIGFHGDTERRRVVALRLGASFPLDYQWFVRSEPVGSRVALTLHHGDMYLMSEKAVGYDWMKKVVPTLRHAAGCAKFTTIKPKKT